LLHIREQRQGHAGTVKTKYCYYCILCITFVWVGELRNLIVM